MPLEIERRFLLKSLPEGVTRFSEIAQGYLSTDSDRTIRIRIEESRAGDMAYITIKTNVADATFSRNEFEYSIPVENAKELMNACIQPVIKKTRYSFGRWEIDEFHDCFNGLIIAEIELDSEDEKIELPHWADNEITGIRKYSNAGLVEGWSNEKNSSVCW
jgi:CYTH domain-containing protein